ncbi:MAG: glutaredoxin domain-containing protein [Nanoarchaeota archaeon]
MTEETAVTEGPKTGEPKTAAAKKVIVYSTPSCPYCIQTKNFLKSKNIKFEEVDVLENQDKAVEIVQATGQTGVPVTKIGDTYVIGFDKAKIAELLHIEL